MNLILETDRLILREMLVSDAEIYLKWIAILRHINTFGTTLKRNYEVHSLSNLLKNSTTRITSVDLLLFWKNLRAYRWAGLKYNTEMVNNKIHFTIG
jgi:hypothetical protein